MRAREALQSRGRGSPWVAGEGEGRYSGEEQKQNSESRL